MGSISMSGKEYLLYLRAHQDTIREYIVDCLKDTTKGILAERELIRLIKQHFPFEHAKDDTEDVILIGIVRNLLGQREMSEKILSITEAQETAYKLLKWKKNSAA